MKQDERAVSNFSSTYKSLFIHLPKCAGSSMECGSVPFSKGSGHFTLQDYLEKYPETSDYHKWSFVRNPYDRICSTWANIFGKFVYSKGCAKDVSRWAEVIGECDLKESFSRFVDSLYDQRGVVQNLPFLRWGSMPKLKLPYQRIHFFPMLPFLKHDNRLGINFVGRYENIEQDWSSVCQSFDTVSALPYLNSRRGKFSFDFPYEKIYSAETARKVAEVYAEDFAAFKYSTKLF